MAVAALAVRGVVAGGGRTRSVGEGVDIRVREDIESIGRGISAKTRLDYVGVVDVVAEAGAFLVGNEVFCGFGLCHPMLVV